MPTLRPIPRPKVPRVGRPTGKFTQHRRLDVLREKLEAHAGGLSLEELAAMLRITTRRCAATCASWRSSPSSSRSRSAPAARTSGASSRASAVAPCRLRRTQAYALLAARRVFDPIRGSALFDEIDVALRAGRAGGAPARPAHGAAGRGRERRAARRALRLRPAVAPGLREPRAKTSTSCSRPSPSCGSCASVTAKAPPTRAGGGKERAAPASRRTPTRSSSTAARIACVARDVDRGRRARVPLRPDGRPRGHAAERFELPADFDSPTGCRATSASGARRAP